MTVSPERASDGNGQPSVGAHGVEPANRSHSEALPPTLFQLPSLKPAQQQSDDSGDQPRSPTPPAVPTAVSTPATTASAPAAIEPSEPQRSEPQRSEPDSRLSFVPDQPAGRTWMETVRSHGVVIVLLLIVIVAALMTGSGSDNEDDGNALADSVQLDIDDGTAVNLPLPVHNHPSDFATADEFSLIDASSEMIATGVTVQPEVSLNAPESSPGTVPVSGENSAPSHGIVSVDAAGADADNVSSGPDDVDVRTASSRIPSEQYSTGLPSLEELGEPTPTDQPTQVNDIGVVRTNEYGVRRTSMPAPIKDWLRHLPAMPTAVTVNAENNTTSE